MSLFTVVHISRITSAIEDELRQADALVSTRLHSNLEFIGRLAGYITGPGGKRVRTMLVLLSALARGYRGDDHIKLSVIIEFIHTATLLHDDVVDDSALRRGRKTVSSLWGNAASVLVGDFLYSRAFQMMCEISPVGILQVLSDATNVIAEGEVRQLVNVGRADTGEAEYMQVIERKTAKLFEAACRTGAMLTTADAQAKADLARFGLQLGLAFQIVDDLLDYSGDTGKPRGQDLKEGKPTLPFIHALQHCATEQAEVLKAAFGNDNDAIGMENVMAIFAGTGSLDYARRQARSCADQACECLASLPPSPYRTALGALPEFVVNRDH